MQVDLVLTDPPYGHNNNNGDLISKREAALGKGTYSPGEDDRPIQNDDYDSANALVHWLFSLGCAHLKLGGICCCCCCGGGPDPQFARWSLFMDQYLDFKMAVVWDKGGLGMGWHYRRSYELMLVGQKGTRPCVWNGGNTTSNVVSIGKIIPQATDHPTPKPLAYMAFFIRLHTNNGDVVFDPFMGSGTTLRASKDLGRKAIGIEIEEKYCEIAAKRLRQEVLPFSRS
jgi:site-specific DNA-methyltransferase (adenine-specific)